MRPLMDSGRNGRGGFGGSGYFARAKAPFR